MSIAFGCRSSEPDVVVEAQNRLGRPGEALKISV